VRCPDGVFELSPKGILKNSGVCEYPDRKKSRESRKKALTIDVYFSALPGTERSNPAQTVVSRHLSGYYPYKMDSKYRVSIPVDWRPAPGETLRLLITKRLELPVVSVLTDEDYEERLRIVDEAENMTPAKKRRIKGMLHSRCRSAAINEQGKLLVPKDWSERVGIKAGEPVVLLGLGQHFEIWNQENHAELEAREMESVKAELEELGVLE
jgi:DNA-binding transcriptional regulator/RsmH inhibitor MraZ